jgi:VWFA-related protein
MCTLFRLFASVLALSGPIWAQAQTPSAGSPRTPVAALASASPSDTDHRVWLDVVVTDKSGNAVPSLVERDFTLLDNKQPRKIASFQATEGTSRATDPALQVIFVLDGVNTGVQAVMYGRAQLSKFLRQDDGKLSVPTSLVILTDQSPQIQATPTRDGKALADSLDSNQTGLRTLGRSTGAYGAEERRTLSLRTLDGLAHYEATQPGRKLIIWLSPGWAILSWPDGVASEKNEQGLFRTIVALSQELREARITLYSLDPSGMNDANGKFYYVSFLKGVPSYQDAQNGNLALQVLATQSGGRVLSVGNDLGKEITSPHHS